MKGNQDPRCGRIGAVHPLHLAVSLEHAPERRLVYAHGRPRVVHHQVSRLNAVALGEVVHERGLRGGIVIGSRGGVGRWFRRRGISRHFPTSFQMKLPPELVSLCAPRSGGLAQYGREGCSRQDRNRAARA